MGLQPTSRPFFFFCVNVLTLPLRKVGERGVVVRYTTRNGKEGILLFENGRLWEEVYSISVLNRVTKYLSVGCSLTWYINSFTK